MTNEKPASPTQADEEAMARALHVLDCHDAAEEYRREGQTPPLAWADPWLPTGIRQLEILRRRAKVLLDALSALDRTTLPPVEGWQTMDSAPKDGHAVLLLVPSSGGFIWTVEGAYQNGQWNAVHRDNVQPTHWARKLPSPAAPQGTRS